MNPRHFRLPLIALSAAAWLTACGSDALTPTAATSSSPAAAATSAPVAATAGGNCTPAPTAAGTTSAADSFSDSVCLVTLSDGLQYGDITTGTGPTPVKGQNVTVQYTGWLTNGTMFDSSRQSGRTPFSFVIGATPPGVIAGWDEGLLTMHVGGKRRLVIPPSLGYGAQANGSIPANSTLVFEVQMLAAAAPSPTPSASATP
jgi:peptidylprolyl isomerase